MEQERVTEETHDEEVPVEVSMVNSAQVEVPPSLIDQVIGQEHAVEVIRKAATQRRHVMMIGSPGTGKSMLAKAMAELLPKEEMQDILVYPNSDDSNNPIVRTVPAGRGKQIVAAHKAEARKKIQLRNTLFLLLLIGIIGYSFITYQWLMGIIAAAFIFMALRYATPREESMVPKLLVSNDATTTAPFIDATGSHAGALLGDVRHDPFQSGGLETPSHDRVEAGAIHRSHKGVLFIDEAYALESGGDGDFGREALAELLKMMEDHRSDLVVIAAGYTEPMHQLMRANPGLTSRFATEWEFIDFTDDQLAGIWESFVTKAGALVGDGTPERVRQMIIAAKALPDFGNARTMRNVAEAAVTSAIARGEPLTVLPEDVPIPER